MLISAGFKFMPYAAYLSSITNLASGVHKFAAVYAGTPPTKEQILTATDAATGNIKWDSLRSVMTDRVLLAYVNTAKPLVAVRDANDLEVNLTADGETRTLSLTATASAMHWTGSTELVVLAPPV